MTRRAWLTFPVDLARPGTTSLTPNQGSAKRTAAYPAQWEAALALVAVVAVVAVALAPDGESADGGRGTRGGRGNQRLVRPAVLDRRLGGLRLAPHGALGDLPNRPADDGVSAVDDAHAGLCSKPAAESRLAAGLAVAGRPVAGVGCAAEVGRAHV